MIWDIMQQLRIDGLAGELRATRENSEEYMRKLTYSSDDRFDKMSLIIEAIWLLVKEKTDLTDEDLSRMITELDLKDGRLDGKLNRAAAQGPPGKCPDCGATVSRKFNRCLFCGYQAEGEASPFNKLD